MQTALKVDVGPPDDAPPLQSMLPGLDPTRSLSDEYELLQSRLGSGEFSEVRLGLRKERLSERVAVKVISKTPSLQPERLQAEVEILRAVAMLDHPNLVKLLDVFETPSKVHLVFEVLSRGTLMDHVAKCGGKPLPETEARDLIWDVVSGLAAIHAIGIVHRDLKLQNIMLDEQHRAKICDFGFAKRASAADIVTVETRRFASPCGTPGFVAPEVSNRRACAPQPAATRRRAPASPAGSKGPPAQPAHLLRCLRCPLSPLSPSTRPLRYRSSGGRVTTVPRISGPSASSPTSF
jgi:serine/threonine protein kinase